MKKKIFFTILTLWLLLLFDFSGIALLLGYVIFRGSTCKWLSERFFCGTVCPRPDDESLSSVICICNMAFCIICAMCHGLNRHGLKQECPVLILCTIFMRHSVLP